MTRGAFGHIGWRQARAPAVAAPPRVGLQVPEVASRQETAEAASVDDRLVSRLVFTVTALYAVTFALLSILQHESFQTHAFDLGNMDQAVWNASQGRGLEFTNWAGGTTRLAAHVEPILFLVALAYQAHSSPVTLLALQSLVIAVGAFPAYWLARAVMQSSVVGAVFAFSYLLSPALEIANLADFHAVSFSSAFLLFAFYFAWIGWRSEGEKPSPICLADVGFLSFAVLSMATKEQVPVTVFGIGLYVALARRRRILGYGSCLLAAAWALTAFFVVIPHFNPQGSSPYISRYERVEVNSLLDPARLEFVRQLLEPTAYLALLSPVTLATAVPELAVNLLSNFQEMYDGQAHYGAVLVPVVMASAIFGAGMLYRLVSPLHRLAGPAAHGVIGGAVLASSLTGFYSQVFLPLADHPPKAAEHHQRVREVLSLIPPDASVSASSTLNPHLSQRQRLFLFPDLGVCEADNPLTSPRCPGPGSVREQETAPGAALRAGTGTGSEASHVVVDVTATPHPIDAANQWYRLQRLLHSGNWGVLAARDGVLLLHRVDLSDQDSGVPRPWRESQATLLPEEFFTFTQAQEQDVRVRLDTSFGPGLNLAGYALEPGPVVHGRQAYASLDLFWRVPAPPAEDFLLSVSLVAPSGEVLFLDRHQATTLWRPPSQWAGEPLVRVHVPRLALEGASRGDIRVTLAEREPPHREIGAPLVLAEITRG